MAASRYMKNVKTLIKIELYDEYRVCNKWLFKTVQYEYGDSELCPSYLI